MRNIKRQRKAGFTLIELLVVLVIIGIVITVGFVSLAGFGLNAKAKETANQLQQVMQVASQQAVMQPAIIGMRIGGHGYQFFQSVASDVSAQAQWRPLIDDQLSRPQAFDSALVVSVKTKHFDGDPSDTKLPEIIFFPSGLATSSVITVAAKKHTIQPYYIKLSDNGTVAVRRGGDD